MEYLRETSPKEIIINNYILNSKFTIDLKGMEIGKILLMKMFCLKYKIESDFGIFLNKLKKENKVAVIKTDEYDLYIIPHGPNIYKYGNLGFVLERYLRDDTPIPGWALLYSKS